MGEKTYDVTVSPIYQFSLHLDKELDLGLYRETASNFPLDALGEGIKNELQVWVEAQHG